MRILLDTGEFLWLVAGDSKLSPALASAVRDLQNQVFLSAVSFWAISLKHSLGKLLIQFCGLKTRFAGCGSFAAASRAMFRYRQSLQGPQPFLRPAPSQSRRPGPELYQADYSQ